MSVGPLVYIYLRNKETQHTIESLKHALQYKIQVCGVTERII